MMMKTVMLVALAAVCISAAPAKSSDKDLLSNIFNALNLTMKNLTEKEHFLSDLKVKGHRSCTNEYFCQTEAELTMFISGISGAEFESFRTDKLLMRNLKAYNRQYHSKTCVPADNLDKIPLLDFLLDLRKCLQMKMRTTN